MQHDNKSSTWETSLNEIHKRPHIRHRSRWILMTRCDHIELLHASRTQANRAASAADVAVVLYVDRRRVDRYRRRRFGASAGFRDQRVALAEFALQMLSRAEAFKAAVHHDCNAGAQRFAFLHAARSSET